MKLISWNVNGLRACINKGFMDFFREIDADVFCIQESKMYKEQADFSFEGYHNFWNSAEKKGYSGVVVLSKNEPLKVEYDMGIAHHDKEGRIIRAEYPHFHLVNVYTPNAKRELERLEYRMEWEDDFRAFVVNLSKSKPVVICGDLNVAHKEIDLKNPKTNRRNAGFTDEERGKMSELLESGFVDTFRYLYPEREAHTAGGAIWERRERITRVGALIISYVLKICNHILKKRVFILIFLGATTAQWA